MQRTEDNPLQLHQAVDDLLARWLRERRALLGKYTEMVVTHDSTSDSASLEKRQTELCVILVDYVSAGHFEVYHELIREAESFEDGSSAMAEKLMPAIGDTTEVILAYEEKYSAGARDTEHLPRDLSALGEILESRFMLEDQLIAGLHGKHRTLN